MHNRFSEFMYGRYGMDLLTVVLLVLSFVLSFILRMTTGGFIFMVSYIPLIFAVYRFFSKDIETRQKENQVFRTAWDKVSFRLKKADKSFKDHQKYKYFKCPNCSQKLRAPRGAGNIKVTCQRCGRSFVKKI